MIRRLNLGVLALAFALLAAPVAPGQATAQEGASSRFRVLVPDLFALQDANRGFGEDVAEELRDLLNTLATHQPIERNEIRDNLRRFRMDMRELDCLRTRQLASQMNAQVALCAGYVESGDQRQLSSIEFIDVATGEVFAVPDVEVHKDREQEAAQQIFDVFDKYVQQVRFTQFCADYQQSQQWDNALRNCQDALALNPAAAETRYRMARILYEMAQAAEGADKEQRFQESYEELQTVLGEREFHEDALQLAGYIAIQLGDEGAGRSHYQRYLEMNPGANAIRLRIAYEMSQAGDPEGAMLFVKEGLDHNPEDSDLLEYYGIYAFATAERMKAEAAVGAENNGPMSPELRTLYETAVQSLNQVYASKGAEMGAGQLRNVAAAYMQLGQEAESEQFLQRVLTTHEGEAALWSLYGDVLQRQGKIDEALTALAEVERIQPDYPNLFVRQGNWLLQAGRRADAIPYFQRAVERGQDANVVARLIFADAHSNGVGKENWGYALEGIASAREFQVNADTKMELDFWEGWSIYQQAVAIQQPQSLETAQRAKPMFERARTLFESARDYAQRRNINVTQILSAATQYIEIQDAIIRRGSR